MIQCDLFLGILAEVILERLSDLDLRDSNGYIELPQSRPINGQNKICSVRSVKDVVVVYDVQRFSRSDTNGCMHCKMLQSCSIKND